MTQMKPSPATTPPTPAELVETARRHLEDAEALLAAGRYDGAVYLCGYAVEIALKARICRTLKWPTFPPGPQDKYRSVITHTLEVLLAFTDAGGQVKPALAAEWSIVGGWAPEMRYYPVGTQDQASANDMIASARALLTVLL